MGNKVNTTSPTECIHDILSGNISFRTCTSEEIATHLEIVIFLGANIANGEIEITLKQLPDLVQVYQIIVKMIDDLFSGLVTDLYSHECLKKAFQAIIHLLIIPQISKKVFEQSVVSIIKHLDLNVLEIFSLSFLAFFTGFRHLEDGSTTAGSSKSLNLRATIGNEDTLRQQICLQLEKHDTFSLLFSYLLNTSASRSVISQFPHQIPTAILIFRFLAWILTRSSSLTNQLRTKLRCQLLQHQETLFEFLKHEDRTLSDASVSILNLIFRQEERGTCIALQVRIQLSCSLLRSL
jgi:hypothetical protein